MINFLRTASAMAAARPPSVRIHPLARQFCQRPIHWTRIGLFWIFTICFLLPEWMGPFANQYVVDTPMIANTTAPIATSAPTNGKTRRAVMINSIVYESE